MTGNRTAGSGTNRSTGRLVGVAAGFLLAGSIVWGCTGQAAAMPVASSQATRAAGSAQGAGRAAAAINAFGIDYYRQALTKGGNAVASPASIVLALSMAQEGAVGDTAAQIDKVLHGASGTDSGNGINSLDRALSALSGTYSNSRGNEEPLTLRIANAPFAQSNYAFRQAYLDALASRHGAAVRLVDFKADAEGARRQVNAWVAEQTSNRIPELLDSLDDSTRLVLVNAIYLKASWMTPFEESATQDAPFARSDGSKVNVPTMATFLEDGRFAEGTGWKAVELPYAGPSLAMTVIVPDDLAAFEKTFDGARFTEITSALAPSSVDLTLPRFKIESKSDLATELAVMGMPLAFDAARADFSGITAEERLFISKVIHQANISVDEKGTEGAAATAVVMLAGSAPVAKAATVHVDRPFIFAVRDTATGAILFLGRVVDPGA